MKISHYRKLLGLRRQENRFIFFCIASIESCFYNKPFEKNKRSSVGEPPGKPFIPFLQLLQHYFSPTKRSESETDGPPVNPLVCFCFPNKRKQLSWKQEWLVKQTGAGRKHCVLQKSSTYTPIFIHTKERVSGSQKSSSFPFFFMCYHHKSPLVQNGSIILFSDHQSQPVFVSNHIPKLSWNRVGGHSHICFSFR